MQMMRVAKQAVALLLLVSLVLPGLAVNVRGGVTAAVEAFAVAEADAEVGSDLGLEVGMEQDSSRGDPATLAEYCAGPTQSEQASTMAEGTRVKADWNDYGQKYPGKVTDRNSDGTVDIAYDDGFTEKNVDTGDVKIRKNQGKGGGNPASQAKAKPRDDPACKLQKFLKDLQDQLKELNGMISEWLGGQRAKIASEEEVPPAPTKAPPKAKAKGNVTEEPTEDQAGQLEELKSELADLDKYIKELEAQDEKLVKQLDENNSPGGESDAAPGVKTVNDLIAEYKGKIAERNARVQELLQRIKKHKEELADRGAGPLSLKDIDEALKKLEESVEEGKRKRDELKKSGELDPELRAIIDAIIESLSKTRAKVDNLLALEAKAEAEEAQAEQEEREAEEAARKKARAEGRDEEEAAAEAKAASRKRSKERSKKASLKTMEAAQEVEKDLKDAEKGATELDTGLHPHGERWWRYRYEHSYIEAVLMIFISTLMLLWSEFWRRLKHYVNLWSLAPGQVAMTELEELEEETHGAVYSCWLKFLADQMLVCIFVFLTVWLIAKSPAIELFPYLIRPSDDMHVPNGEHAAAEYRRLALDICTIFFFAIVFYFGLMFSVAHHMSVTTFDIEQMEIEGTPRGQRQALTRANSSSFLAPPPSPKRMTAMGSIHDAKKHFEHLKNNFANHMSRQMILHPEDEELKEISRLLNDNFNNLPLSAYLRMNVQAVGSELFMMKWTMWLPVIVLFMGLMLLHRYAHMGYVRIMGVSAVAVFLIIACMTYFTKSIVQKCSEDNEEDHVEDEPAPKSSIHEAFSSESFVLCMLEFCLFFVCYGVARMICQPWMWELHFWPVFFLTIVAIVSATLFVFVVAPGIPSFICVMALPPYVDPYNMKIIKQVAVGLDNKNKRA